MVINLKAILAIIAPSTKTCSYTHIHTFCLFLNCALQTKVEVKEEKKRKEKTNDYFTNLNMDPALSGYIKHFLEGDMTIGSKRGEHTDITLPGNQARCEDHDSMTQEISRQL